MNDNKPLAALAEELERIGNEAANAFTPTCTMGKTVIVDIAGDLAAARLAISKLARAILIISQAMKDVE